MGRSYYYEVYDFKTKKKVFDGTPQEIEKKYKLNGIQNIYNIAYRCQRICDGKYFIKQVPLKHEFVVKTLQGKEIFKGDNKEVASYLNKNENYIWMFAKENKVINDKYTIEKIS